MTFSWDLLVNAIITGVLLGGFYAPTAIGITIEFGMLDIVNIAHPAFMIVGAYLAYSAGIVSDFDPFVSMAVFAPAGLFFGRAFYRAYHFFFERRGDESLQGLAFFFGILFIVEIGLVLIFGVDYRSITAPYIGPVFGDRTYFGFMAHDGPVSCRTRHAGGIKLYLSRTFTGRTILAVSQDVEACALSAPTQSGPRNRIRYRDVRARS